VKLTDEDVAALRAAYAAGDSVAAIADRYGIARNYARRLARYGRPPRKPLEQHLHRKLTDADVAEIQAAYLAGVESREAIGARYGVSGRQVYVWGCRVRGPVPMQSGSPGYRYPPEMMQRVQDMRARGVSYQKIAKILGLGESTAFLFSRGKRSASRRTPKRKKR